MKAWLELRRLPKRIWVLAAATMINRMGTMALPFLPLYSTKALGFSTGQAAAVLALYGIVAFAVGPFAGRLCDRWGTGRVMLSSLTLSGLLRASRKRSSGIPHSSWPSGRYRYERIIRTTSP